MIPEKIEKGTIGVFQIGMYNGEKYYIRRVNLVERLYEMQMIASNLQTQNNMKTFWVRMENVIL